MVSYGMYLENDQCCPTRSNNGCILLHVLNELLVLYTARRHFILFIEMNS